MKYATQEISEGRFEYTPEISNDELGALSYSFREMAERLKRLESLHLDANPLTRLPGGRAIEDVLQNRLDAKGPLAFCLLDMDNFKAFNDHYGYASGSELIKETARVIEKSVRSYGAPDDFIGHIGGDDFVLITSPERSLVICNEVIQGFDSMAPLHYTEEDRGRGYIISKNRQGDEVQFPLMTLSIAVVTNLHRRLTNTVEVGEIAAELKEYAKLIPGSVYVVDKRRKDEAPAVSVALDLMTRG
ncbi:MAG: diguanylate cyclase [Nitrospirae bacterium]|nr:MAG: diguanylate cyclase [Nitrospirota bacterium]